MVTHECDRLPFVQMASNDRQRTLLRRLNVHLEQLSRTIEAVVSESLSVRLEPVDLRLEKPSASEFHDSLQELFAAGAPSTHTHTHAHISRVILYCSHMPFAT